MFEMERDGMNEIEGEHMAVWHAKGYPLVEHRPGEPCFPCTLSRLTDSLPVVFHGG